MGRGRAKAKQTKVARELKYGGPETDFSRLQAELASQGVPAHEENLVDDDDEDDPYAKYAIDDDDDDLAVDERRHA
jgi:hypothetical protein